MGTSHNTLCLISAYIRRNTSLLVETWEKKEGKEKAAGETGGKTEGRDQGKGRYILFLDRVPVNREVRTTTLAFWWVSRANLVT